MAEPILNTGCLNLSETKYLLVKGNKFIDLESSEIEGVHLHDCFEIYINLEGDVSFFVKNHIFPITRGDIIFTRPNELHYCLYKSSCQHRHFCLWFTENNVFTKMFESSSNFISADYSVKEKLISSFMDFYEANERNDVFEATAHFMEILSIIRRESESHGDMPKHSAPPVFQDILDYINIHYGEITNINEIYPRFFTSPSTLRRWFITQVNMTPKSYLEYIKLSNAKRMFSEGLSVTDVCYACGYSDCSHFINVFKKNFGQTPLQYKSGKKNQGLSEETL